MRLMTDSANNQIMKRWSMLFGDDSPRFVSDLLLFRVHRTTKIMAIIGMIIYVAAILCRISYGYPNYNKVKTFFQFFFFFQIFLMPSSFYVFAYVVVDVVFHRWHKKEQPFALIIILKSLWTRRTKSINIVTLSSSLFHRRLAESYTAYPHYSHEN